MTTPTTFIGFMLVVFAILWAILSICIPFMVYAIMKHTKAAARAAEATQQSTANIAKNVYIAISENR